MNEYQFIENGLNNAINHLSDLNIFIIVTMKIINFVFF